MLELVPGDSDMRDADVSDPAGETPASRPQELLARVGRGDRQAFSALYDEMAPRVLGLVTRLLRDPAQSEEVTQEIFLEIWRTSSRFDPNKGGASTWILTMTHRRAVDRVRASQASRDRDVKVGIRDLDADYDHVAESVEVRIEHERVEKAMARLTDMQRQAITLSYYGGYSNSEVAEILSVPIGTIKTRIRDGMIRLRDEMGVAS
jgi:RNA polymerase sigma-70 factor (ECF subfamily)